VRAEELIVAHTNWDAARCIRQENLPCVSDADTARGMSFGNVVPFAVSMCTDAEIVASKLSPSMGMRWPF